MDKETKNSPIQRGREEARASFMKKLAVPWIVPVFVCALPLGQVNHLHTSASLPLNVHKSMSSIGAPRQARGVVCPYRVSWCFCVVHGYHLWASHVKCPPLQRSYIFTEPEGGWVARGQGVYPLAWEKPEGEGGSDRAAVQRPVIRSTAPTSCLTQLATTLTHPCLTSTFVSVLTCWPEFFELTKYASADSFLLDLDTGLERLLGVCYTLMQGTFWNELEGGWLGNYLQYAGSIMEWAGRWLTHGWALYCSHLTTYSCNGMGPGTLTYQEPLIPVRCSDEASQAEMAQMWVLCIIILGSSPVGMIPLL